MNFTRVYVSDAGVAAKLGASAFDQITKVGLKM
jgi:hypothetical protein